MPIFKFEAPDGKIHRIEAPEGATQEQALAFLQKQIAAPAPTPAVTNPTQPAPKPSMLRSLGREFAGGGTFEFSPELEAGLGAAIEATNPAVAGGVPYMERAKTLLPSIEGERKAFQREHPYLSGAAQLAGMAATSGGIGGLAKKAAPPIAAKIASTPLLRSFLAPVGAGAVGGATYGAGAAESGKRLEGALEGGLMGAVAGPVGLAATKLVSGLVAKPISTLFGQLTGLHPFSGTAYREGLKHIASTAKKAGLSADDLIKLAEEQKKNFPQLTKPVLADLDEEFAKLGGKVGDFSGKAKRRTEDVTKGRMLRLPQEAYDQLVEIGSISRPLSGLRKYGGPEVPELIKEFKSGGKPLIDKKYAKAWKHPVVMDQTLTDALNSSKVREALRKANETFPSTGLKVGKNKIKGTPNMRTLDQTVRLLDDEVDDLFKSGSAGANAAIQLRQDVDKLTSALYKQSNDYLSARELSANMARAQNLVNQGFDFDKLSRGQLAEITGSLNDPLNRIIWANGVINKVENMLLKTKEHMDVSKNPLISTPEIREKLSIALGINDPDIVQKFVQALQDRRMGQRLLTGKTSGGYVLPQSEALTNYSLGYITGGGPISGIISTLTKNGPHMRASTAEQMAQHISELPAEDVAKTLAPFFQANVATPLASGTIGEAVEQKTDIVGKAGRSNMLRGIIGSLEEGL